MVDLISEIALRCSDSSFDDFHPGIYKRSLLVASRKVAKKYNLIERLYKFDNKIPIPETADDDYLDEQILVDVVLSLMSFVSEYSVRINNKEYLKVNAVKEDEYQYVLYRNENQIKFNYSPRTQNDVVEIYYKSDINNDDYDVEEIEPVIPSQYNEEVISSACVEMAKLGIAKFPYSEKEKKYSNILKLYQSDERSLDKNLIKNEAWTSVKVWNVY